MSALLARLGALSYRRPVLVLLVWAVVAAGVAGLVRNADTHVSTSVTVEGTPAQDVLDQVRVALPEAAGAQGTVVFRAQEGRVDDPGRARAVADALAAAVGTGYVVDREAMRAEQEADLRGRATEAALDQTGRQLDDALGRLATNLAQAEQEVRGRSEEVAAQRATLGAGSPPQLQESARQLAAREADLAGLRDTVTRLEGVPVERQLDQLGSLSAQLQQVISADPAAQELLDDGLDEDTRLLLTSGADPREQLAEKVDEQVAGVLDDLDRLRRGVPPVGLPMVAGGETVPGVSVSQDGTVAVLEVQLSEQLDDLPPGAADEVVDALTAGAAAAGLDAYPSDSLQPLEPPVGGHEAVGLLVAGVVLVLTLGSLVAAGLPLLTAVLGVAVGVGGAFGLSGFYEMTSTTPVLALMLGLAVGIDYALFILFRQRRLIIEQGMSAREATRLATGTAGSAVLFAGTTVIVALLGLLVLDIGFVTTMAVAAAATVGLAVLVSLTALPALLGLLGERVVGRRARHRVAGRSEGDHRAATGGTAGRWVTSVTARPWVVVVAVVALLGALAAPAVDLRLGMPAGTSAAPGSPERLNADLAAQALGAGSTSPLLVTVPRPGAEEPDLDRLEATVEQLAGVPGAAGAALRGVTADGTLEIYAVTPQAGATAASTETLVSTLRQPGVIDGAERLGVTGLAAINIDLSHRLAEAVPVYLGIVVALALLILLLVFRSLVVPLVATLGFLLTVGATLGLTTAVFGTASLGWLAGVDRPGVVLSFLPIMATGILYGLAMDYQVFLTTAMREAHVHGASGRGPVVDGFVGAGRVVVAAAVIMVSVFAGFVLTDDPVVTQFGFALAVGVLVDAFLVRMTLMPAVLHLAGRAAWWLPAWLDRALPRLDVEGSAVAGSRGTPGAGSGSGTVVVRP